MFRYYLPMIPRIVPADKTPDWQTSLAAAITDPAELLKILGLTPTNSTHAFAAQQQFRLKVPLSYLHRIRKGDRDDPLLLQVLPRGVEMEAQPSSYSSDPVGDTNASPLPGLIHKYRNRVLLITSPACAIHCRYCFRRHFPYSSTDTIRGQWQTTLDYIAARPEIEEVILSGGDPLTLSDRRLRDLSLALQTIPTVKRLRIHSRLPIVLPERVNAELLEWMRNSRLDIIMVIHCNHAQELADDVVRALQQLNATGLRLFNQAVLLKGVNDRAPVLAELSEQLFSARVQPYYLHLLDKVSGAAHFDVGRAEAKQIYQQLSTLLPGYLLPKLVTDEPGAAAKTLLLP